MLMAGGEDLIVIFLGLELMSVAVYVLAGIDRRSARAAEAALKYFLLGAFASAFLLYGIALAYGATGTTNLSLIGLQVASLGERPPIAAADADITRQVQARLSQETPLSRVDVRTDSGTVALTGAVATIDVSARASELARGVPGVRSVTNELTYDPATHPPVKSGGPRPLPPR